MIITFNELYMKTLADPYFILEETFKDRTTYRVCWAARLTNGKIVNAWDWCYLSGEYRHPESAQRRLPVLRTRNEASLV